MSEFLPPSLCWYPDLPDYRDYWLGHETVQRALARLEPAPTQLPSRVDLRPYFPPIWDQGNLNASTAHAAVALVEYFQRRAHGQFIEGSVRFVYKTTRALLRREGDTGANLRTTLKAIVRFGIPPLEYCPYDVMRFDEELDPFLYSFGDHRPRLLYLRLDSRNAGGGQTLAVMKAFLAAGFPSMFGFSLPNSLNREADIPWRPTYDKVRGGQAVVAVGYDDRRLRSTKGALLIRNSWGTQWGEEGYGWLPYRYIEQQLALDFWTLLSDDWLASREFRQPHVTTSTQAVSGPDSVGVL